MGTYAERRCGNLRRRKPGSLPERLGYILIVSEGTNTEPNYFNGIKRLMNSETGRKFTIKPIGVGKSTLNLVKEAIQIRNELPNTTEAWIVLDYDNDKHFNDAIELAASEHFFVAWSNPCFEVWLIMHISESMKSYSDAQECKSIMQSYFCRYLNKEYKENNKEIFKDIKQIGSLTQAIKIAKHRDESFMKEIECGHLKPSDCNNNTKVYQLVEKIHTALLSQKIDITS